MMIAALLPIVGSIIDKVIPDANAREQAKVDMEKALVENANAINLAIQEVNKAEAMHRSVWVAGWRPAVGWLCAAGFGWAFVGDPIARWVLLMMEIQAELPDMDTAPLTEMLFGMLGIAGLRSWEKSRGLTK